MKTQSCPEKSGAVLVIVMVVLVALTLIVTALLQLGGYNERETIRQLRLEQARWLAEAGLERGLSYVMASSNYWGALHEWATVLENDETLLDNQGSYRVELTKTNIVSGTVQINVFNIRSTGMVSNDAMAVTDTVRLSFTASPGGQQALLALGGNSSIANGVNVIDGTIYCDGDLSVGSNTKVTDIVEVTGNLTGSPVPVGDLPDPAVKFDPGPYTNLFASATNNNVVINSNLTGPVTIVATGNVTVATGIVLSNGVKIVAKGNVSFGNHAVLETGTEVFSSSDIRFATQGATVRGTTLLAMEDIDPAKNLDFQGIMYAKERINVTSGSNIRGTLIAGQGFDIAANVTVTYDPNVFASPNPLNYGNGMAIVSNSWRWAEAPF